jgi:hypothetical protein
MCGRYRAIMWSSFAVIESAAALGRGEPMAGAESTPVVGRPDHVWTIVRELHNALQTNELEQTRV